MKKINANYAFVFYDVNVKRVHKVFKVCKKYLTHYQYSVFRGQITPSNIMKMRKEIESIVDLDEDFVTFITLINDRSFAEYSLGDPKLGDPEDLFL